MKRLLILNLLFIVSAVFSQPKDNDKLFRFDALNFYSPEGTKSRVDIYIEVPFERLSFTKSKDGSGYSSEIDFTVTVKDKGTSAVVYNQVYKEVIKTPKTNLEYLSRNSQIIVKNIFLNPGRYILTIASKEKSSKNLSEIDRDITVRDFTSQPVTISDVMTVSKVNMVGGKKFITPLISRNAGSLDTVYLFFFVYLNSQVSSTGVKYKITNSAGENVLNGEQFLDIKSGLEPDNQVIVTVPTAQFSNDKYKVEIDAVSDISKAASTSEFEFRWLNFPINLNDIDEAVDQLQYIATDEELTKIKKAKNSADKQKRLIEFWKSKDPSPNTTRNEVMEEYYKRISFANKTYSNTYTVGWRTDMGMVYIIFGLPSNVERHPYDMDNKPYEIWDYYDINRQFIFVDNSGFGDYRLVTPIWDTFKYKN